MSREASAETRPDIAGLRPEVMGRLHEIWRRAYAARSTQDLVDLYASWAENYDEDHSALGYFGHHLAAHALADQLGDLSTAEILDAGAGTGAAGVELAKLGALHLTAIDLSPDMLQVAHDKGVYERAFVADLGRPIDQLVCDEFDAAILVGVFSYGQAPAHALEEILRVVRPGGLVVITLREDFRDEDAMGVRSRIEQLEADGAWTLRAASERAQYLPKKDPEAMFRVWCYEVLESKATEPSPEFCEAVRAALTGPSSVKVIDHAHIWDAAASRLYNDYIEQPEYYLTECEEEILCMHADRIIGSSRRFVELGCGSARKIGHLLEAACARGRVIEYIPIDVSDGALEETARETEERFGDLVDVRPALGMFEDTLTRIPSDEPKTIVFFGGSVGNMATLEECIAFLESMRERMMPRDRFIVGFDLQKAEEIFVHAYNAGSANRDFFVHMVRRINWLLGGNFDVSSFQLGSTYDEEPPYRGMETRVVNLKVVTRVPQAVRLERLSLDVTLDAGDAIQVGVSRKFRTDDVSRLAALAGLRVRTMWFDTRHWFTLAELVREDAPKVF